MVDSTTREDSDRKRKNKLGPLSLIFVLSLSSGLYLQHLIGSLTTIGATAKVEEISTGAIFNARVDTGASLCSLHCESYKIANESSEPFENVGSTIRFPLKNKNGEIQWIETEVVDYSRVRNVHATKPRYHVRLNLSCLGKQREVLVTLADRSSMKHAMLLGRNFLEGQFTVDVSLAAEAR